MRRIGILYICTGPYVLFWHDFYESFEKKFLPDFEKYYYVFTDHEEEIESHNDKVQIFHLDPQPWPLVTLLRFHTFLSIKDKLVGNDYLMFSNANIVCNDSVEAGEFLPREEEGEKLFFTEHPGYYHKKARYAPYDRNPKCLAYVPYDCGSVYVIGAMFGGTSEAFISLSESLRDRINEDLKKGVIARWHDESHINRYIIGRSDCRILSPSYCYPVGFDLPIPNKICGVSKQDKFDVNKFKGYYSDKQKVKLSNNTKVKIKERIADTFYFRDKVLGKKIEPLL